MLKLQNTMKLNILLVHILLQTLVSSQQFKLQFKQGAD